MAEVDKVKSTGKTSTEEAVAEASAEFAEPIKAELPEERQTKFSRTNFSRMKLEWPNEDRLMVAKIHRQVDAMMDEAFGDAISLRYEIMDLVREKKINTTTGKPVLGEDGLPVWRQTSTGLYVEDWKKLNTQQRINYIFKLQMMVIDWENRSAQIWAEAMFAKARWEEAYAIGFDSIPASATIPAHEAKGKRHSAEERYFAIYLSYFSRTAEALVRNMNNLLLRISQVHQAASGR